MWDNIKIMGFLVCLFVSVSICSWWDDITKFDGFSTKNYCV